MSNWRTCPDGRQHEGEPRMRRDLLPLFTREACGWEARWNIQGGMYEAQWRCGHVLTCVRCGHGLSVPLDDCCPQACSAGREVAEGEAARLNEEIRREARPAKRRPGSRRKTGGK